MTSRKIDWQRARRTSRINLHAVRNVHEIVRVKSVAPPDKPKTILAIAEVIARLKARWPTDKRPK